MKHTEEQLQAYDQRWKGRMNPRNTFHCPICGKYYNGTDETTLMFDEEKTRGGDDCVHGNDTEITEAIYNSHIKDLKDNGFLSEEDLLEE